MDGLPAVRTWTENQKHANGLENQQPFRIGTTLLQRIHGGQGGSLPFWNWLCWLCWPPLSSRSLFLLGPDVILPTLFNLYIACLGGTRIPSSPSAGCSIPLGPSIRTTCLSPELLSGPQQAAVFHLCAQAPRGATAALGAATEPRKLFHFGSGYMR